MNLRTLIKDRHASYEEQGSLTGTFTLKSCHYFLYADCSLPEYSYFLSISASSPPPCETYSDHATYNCILNFYPALLFCFSVILIKNLLIIMYFISCLLHIYPCCNVRSMEVWIFPFCPWLYPKHLEQCWLIRDTNKHFF